MAQMPSSIKISVFPVSATKEDWSDLFHDYIASLHTTIYGQAMYCSTPDELRRTSDWFAEAVTKALEHAHVNSS